MVKPRKQAASNTIANLKMQYQKSVKNAKEIDEAIDFFSSEDLEQEPTIKEEIFDENRSLSGNPDEIYHPSISVNAKRVEALINKDDEENLDLENDGIYGKKGVLEEEVFGDYGFLDVPNPDFGHKLKNFSDNKVL